MTPVASRDVRANPTNARGRYVETAEYILAARRFVRGAGRRVASMNIDDLDMLAALAEETAALLDETARALHDESGFSWDQIGEAVGYQGPNARQMAYKRFGKGKPRRAFPALTHDVAVGEEVGVSGRKYAGRRFVVERINPSTVLLAPVSGNGPKVRAFHDLLTDPPAAGADAPEEATQ
jgi:hypothetical protein